MMMFRRAAVVLSGLMLPLPSYAAPPKELYSKSVRITWTEIRVQRPVGERAWRQVRGNHTFNIYVSEAGRVFNNESYSTRRGSAERKGEIAETGTRLHEFNGRSLVVMMASGVGGATRINADFDAGFGSCSAQVTRAKEAGEAIIRAYSVIIKRAIEIKSVQIRGESCSIRSGNVFAN
jgi:hypothetical protein